MIDEQTGREIEEPSTEAESETTLDSLPTGIACDAQLRNAGNQAFWWTLSGAAIVSALFSCWLTPRPHYSKLVVVDPFEVYRWQLLNALYYGQIAIAGMWLGLGVARLAIRLATAFGVIGLYVALRFLGGLPADYFVLLLVATSLIGGAAATLSFLLRLAGARVAPRKDTRPGSLKNDRGRRQFSLRQIFAWTTGLAVVAGILRYVGRSAHLEDMGRFWYLLPEVAICFCAAYIALGDSRFARWAPLPVALAIGLGLAFHFNSMMVCYMTVAEMVFVMLTLLPFRLLGYRVRFRADIDRRLPRATPELVLPENQTDSSPSSL